MATSSFKDYFSKQASDYAKYRPHYPEALFAYLATLTTNHKTAWDCATGNGQVAIGLTPYFQTIYATDASATQIANAFPHDRIHYSVAPARDSGLPDRSMDLITVGLALHWFDLEAFYTEVRRVAKPQGAIAVWGTGMPAMPTAPQTVQQLLKEFDQMIQPFKPPQVQLLDEEYRTIPFPFEEVVTPSFTRTAAWTVDQYIGYVSTWSATQLLAEQQRWGAIAHFSDELQQAWGKTPRTVEWAIYLRAGRINP
ncbi:methyltransferase domain-containing protein [Oscillatoria sp. FACHB-1407]|uniref:class I SAM-dependent methyltransferase n=1 Tax=Oscillatoria sp. FACHB-1407 TaxID=2692847 RepID=UPI001688FE28|nr:methyltransferase domain-containing protein [Oscillatoria sp. FACHB-1407]MBD2461080.1 methyltransferase domain-containing protein [Oscillatoria sp. FACHB-1407]